MTFLVFGSVLLVGAARSAAPEAERVTLTGKVIPLADAIKPLGLAVDRETLANQVVLQSADGINTPLLSDDASRALFRDERLRGRTTEIHGRRLTGLPYLQVTSFKVEEKGKLRIPEYYCDVCSISVRFPQICPCCQGYMTLRWKPDEP
jgi:hypothetical protein